MFENTNMSLKLVEWENISLEHVNIENSPWMVTSWAGLTGIIICCVNLPIIKEVLSQKELTFINILIILDCSVSLAHVPVLNVFYK